MRNNEDNGGEETLPEGIEEDRMKEVISSSRSSGDDNNVGLSKNKLRKAKNRLKALERRAEKRAKERERRKEARKKNDEGISKRTLGNDEKAEIAERLRAVMSNNEGPKVVIDCGYDKLMSRKELTKLAQQLRRAYSSNKASCSPLHLIFSRLSKGSEFYEICCKVNDGFAKYCVDMRENCFVSEILEIKKLNSESDDSFKEVIYLSPDSGNVLEELEAGKVYVIGGIVDETTTKNISLKSASEKGLCTVRLPIDEYFQKDEGKGTCKKVLTVNQVFDILLKWYETKDWVEAIKVGLPERTGFVPRRDKLQE